jgi:hypothetical protein
VSRRIDKGRAAWRRWRAFARKAAEVQSEVVLGALFVAVVPFAVARRLFARSPRRPAGWRARPQLPADLAASRRQY